MGYAIHVDAGALTGGAAELARVAQTLDGVAGRLTGACVAAADAAGGAELSVALEAAGRSGGSVLGEGAGLVAGLARVTAAASTDYRMVERALTWRWTASGALTAGSG